MPAPFLSRCSPAGRFHRKLTPKGLRHRQRRHICREPPSPGTVWSRTGSRRGSSLQIGGFALFLGKLRHIFTQDPAQPGPEVDQILFKDWGRVLKAVMPHMRRHASRLYPSRPREL